MGKHSKLNWQDFYYSDLIDPEYEIFDEETQRVHKRKHDNGWDDADYTSKKGFVEDYSDEWYLDIKNGKTKRK